MLVPNWLQTLLKSWTVWLAAAAVLLPEIVAQLDVMPLDPAMKDRIRFWALMLIPVVRILRQPGALAVPDGPSPAPSPILKGDPPDER